MFPLLAFTLQSTWEDHIGFDFDEIWFMPEGEHTLPILQWQRDVAWGMDHLPTVDPRVLDEFWDVLSLANRLYFYLSHGADLPGIDPTFEGWFGWQSTRRYHMNAGFVRTANFTGTMDAMLSLTSVSVSLMLAGVGAKNPAQVAQSAASAAMGFSRLALEQAVDVPKPPDARSFISHEAARGNEMARDGLDTIYRIFHQTLNAGGRITSISTAYDFIHAFHSIEMGMASLRLGYLYFAEVAFRTTPWDNLARVLLDVAAGLLPKAAGVDDWFAGELAKEVNKLLIQALLTATADHELLHQWARDVEQIEGQLDYWLNGGAFPGEATHADLPSFLALQEVTAAIAAGLVPVFMQTRYTTNATRADFAALAVALYERVAGEITGRVMFTDTTDVNVQKAAYIGVDTGVGNNRFDPQGRLTREQGAVMLVRLAEIMGHPLPATAFSSRGVIEAEFFDGREVSDWAIDSILRVSTAGVMSSSSIFRFDPQGAFTREEAIVAMMRLFSRTRAG